METFKILIAVIRKTLSVNGIVQVLQEFQRYLYKNLGIVQYRKFKKLVGKEWLSVDIQDLNKGDLVIISEDHGEMVDDGYNFIVMDNPFKNTDGNWCIRVS